MTFKDKKIIKIIQNNIRPEMSIMAGMAEICSKWARIWSDMKQEGTVYQILN